MERGRGTTSCVVFHVGTEAGEAEQHGLERAMGWTDERVEILKKLWLDGLSASQIAKQLGGVTRNAVIGKVHRLGLSGRAAPSHPSRPAFKAPRPPRPMTMPAPRPRAAEPRAHHAPAVRPQPFVELPGHGHRADAGRPHVQMADRRSVHRRLHLLRPPGRRRGALLRRPRPRRLPAAPEQEALGRGRTGQVAPALYLSAVERRPSPARGEGSLDWRDDRDPSLRVGHQRPALYGLRARLRPEADDRGRLRLRAAAG